MAVFKWNPSPSGVAASMHQGFRIRSSNCWDHLQHRQTAQCKPMENGRVPLWCSSARMRMGVAQNPDLLNEVDLLFGACKLPSLRPEHKLLLGPTSAISWQTSASCLALVLFQHGLDLGKLSDCWGMRGANCSQNNPRSSEGCVPERAQEMVAICPATCHIGCQKKPVKARVSTLNNYDELYSS